MRMAYGSCVVKTAFSPRMFLLCDKLIFWQKEHQNDLIPGHCCRFCAEWGEGDGQCTLWTLTRKVGYRAVPQQKIYLALHCCCFLCCWFYPLFTFTLLCPVIASCLLPTPVATNAISGNNEWLQLVESLHGLQLLMCFPACCATAGALQISQWNQQHLLFFNLSSSKELFPISQQVLHRTKGMLYSSGRSQRDYFSIFP